MPQNAPLRVTLNGIARKGPGFGFRFAGRDVTGFAGESLAAALVAEGELALRQTAQGDRRGIYCGMGVCGDCSIEPPRRRAGDGKGGGVRSRGFGRAGIGRNGTGRARRASGADRAA